MTWESTEISCKFEGMGNKDIFWRKRPWLSSENQRTTWYQKKKKKKVKNLYFWRENFRKQNGERSKRKGEWERKINEKRKYLSWEDSSYFQK